MSDLVYDVAVIGSGAAGSMGVLRGVLNNLKTVCFMGDPGTKKKSRATWVGKVENMPVLFDSPKAVFQSANEVFKWIKDSSWSENLQVVKDKADQIEGKAGDFKITTGKGEVFRAKYIVLCTGIMDIQPEIQGEIKNVFPMANEGHIEYCIRCDGHKAKGKNTGVIGHKEPAAWIASLLHERYLPPSMTVFTNGQKLEMGDTSAVRERMKCYGVQVYEEPILSFHGDPKKEGLTAIELEGGKVVPCEIAYVTLGTIVYNSLAESLGCEIDDRGYVVTDEFGETRTPGVFAGGDLRAGKKKQIYTAWDITVDSLDRVDNYIRTEKREHLLKECQVRDGKELEGARM